MTDDQRKSALFRAVNDRILEISAEWDVSQPAGFVCECDDPGCNEILSLTVAEYEAVRAHDDCFVVLRGHEAPGRDSVVAQSGGHAIVDPMAPSTGLLAT